MEYNFFKYGLFIVPQIGVHARSLDAGCTGHEVVGGRPWVCQPMDGEMVTDMHGW